MQIIDIIISIDKQHFSYIRLILSIKLNLFLCILKSRFLNLYITSQLTLNNV
ncbi:Uncharacterised protein [Klebsiella pneumoniae]|nr:Uncharacterised protein [Klebsiella pneumoniae]